VAARRNNAARTEQGRVIVTRVFDAPRALVFDAWSSAEHIKHWFAPEGFSVPYAAVDFRVGGTWRVCQRSPKGKEFWGQGVFQEIVRPERLVFTDTLLGPADAPRFEMMTIVTFTEKARDKTEIVLEARVIELHDPSALPLVLGMGESWRQTIERLAIHITDPGRGKS
jgi:uncharacterized protein YndB with AHSA1/START domain